MQLSQLSGTAKVVWKGGTFMVTQCSVSYVEVTLSIMQQDYTPDTSLLSCRNVECEAPWVIITKTVRAPHLPAEVGLEKAWQRLARRSCRILYAAPRKALESDPSRIIARSDNYASAWLRSLIETLVREW